MNTQGAAARRLSIRRRRRMINPGGIWPTLFAALSLIGAPAASAQNGANAYLLSLSAPARAEMLGKIIGAGCIGNQTFYMGTGTSGLAKNESFWSVRCQNGRSYVVQAHPDGKSTVMECSTLKAMHAGECFKKLP